MGDRTSGDRELVPPGYRFDVVWRGFHRRQVHEYLDTELRILATDRDAAVATVYDLARLLEESRSEIGDLRDRLDRLYRDPLAPDAVERRLRRLVEVAHEQAAAIVTRARSTAEHLHVASLERIRQQEARAEQRRRQIEDDFQIAMAARRTATTRALREHEAIRRTEAEHLVRDAHDEARRRIHSAATQVDALRETHWRLAHRLHTVSGLLVRACGLVDSDVV